MLSRRISWVPSKEKQSKGLTKYRFFKTLDKYISIEKNPKINVEIDERKAGGNELVDQASRRNGRRESEKYWECVYEWITLGCKTGDLPWDSKKETRSWASKECMLLSCAVTEVARLFGSEHSMIQSTCRQNTAMQFLTVWKTT